jgi:phosphoserine phosphatase
VEVQTADQLRARIEALASAQPGGVVATDADGTLWQGDVGEDLFHAFLEHGRVEPAALEAMRREAHGSGLSDAGPGAEVARRLYEAYVAGGYSEESICEVMTWCFAGWTRGEVDAFAREVARTRAIASRLHREVTRVLEHLRAAGIETFLVSASPFAIVREAAALVGFAAEQIVAAHPRYKGEVMLAQAERPIPYGEGKVARLRERVGPTRILYAALGDNAFDVALLASARTGVAVRPKPRLRERAHQVPGLVELAPEN